MLFRISKKIKETAKDLTKLNIAILASYTANVLENYIIVELAKRGIQGNIIFTPFGQFEQQILDRNSELYQSQADIIVLLPRLEDIATNEYGEVSQETLKTFTERFETWCKHIREQSSSVIISANLAQSNSYLTDIADPSSDENLGILLANANAQLAQTVNNHTDCYLFDYKKAISQHGMRTWQDDKLFYLGSIVQSSTAQMATATSISRLIAATQSVPAKCLVLDADNTLWGGVVGEDGVGGIKLSDSYPGNVFKDFHRYILRLRSKGIILALSSKNNPEDIYEVFEKHPECLLKADHFAAIKANWKDKASNINEIAKELNIGLNAMVFVDDNPVERAWVKENIPEIIVPDLPNNPMEYIECIETIEAFDFLRISNEDKKRADMYATERKRRRAKEESGSLEDFLKGLDMTAHISPINKGNMSRVIQLLHKTNQFNLTVKRHSETEVTTMLEQGAIGITLRLSDKFGDNGLIGIAIALPAKETQEWLVDTFLLSCRVLGRNAEDLLLAVLSEKIIETNKHEDIFLTGEYIQAKKNAQVADFYKKRDFKEHQENRWIRNITKTPIKRPQFITVKITDDE